MRTPQATVCSSYDAWVATAYYRLRSTTRFEGSSVRLQQLTIGAMDPYPTFRFEHARSPLPCPQCGRPCVSSSVTIFNSYFEDHWKGYLYTFSHDTAPAMCARREEAQPSWPSNWRSVRFVVVIGDVELEATADTSKLTRRSC